MTTNPKDAIGITKARLDLVPPILSIEVSKAMADGAKKYTPYNWREAPVRMTVYLAAMMRHILACLDGEDNASDSGIDHLAHVAAGVGIVLDARACGTLIDDRNKAGVAAKALASAQESKAADAGVDPAVDDPDKLAVIWEGTPWDGTKWRD